MRGRPRHRRAGRARRRGRERHPRRTGDVQGRGAAAARRPGAAGRARRVRATATSSARIQAEASAGFNDDRLELVRASAALEAELSGEPDHVAAQRGGEGRLAARAGAGARRGERGDDGRLDTPPGHAGSSGCSARSATEVPNSSHVSYMRRLSPLDGIYTKERCVEVCLETLDRLGFALGDEPNIRLDLDDRPQKSPRACVIASDPPAVVHLITRAQGGLHDYQAFLHEAGHALHYAGCDPELPYTFRKISRDHALTEIYSYILEAISREPAWHAEHFGLSDTEAARERGGDRRSWRRCSSAATPPSSRSSSTSGRGSTRTAGRRTATRSGSRSRPAIHYRPDAYLSDMDSGFYSADYLRAWIRAAQLRHRLVARGRRGLVAPPGDRRAAAGALPRGHDADERGDRRPARVRPARHRAARRRARLRPGPPAQPEGARGCGSRAPRVTSAARGAPASLVRVIGLPRGAVCSTICATLLESRDRCTFGSTTPRRRRSPWFAATG